MTDESQFSGEGEGRRHDTEQTFGTKHLAEEKGEKDDLLGRAALNGG